MATPTEGGLKTRTSGEPIFEHNENLGRPPLGNMARWPRKDTKSRRERPPEGRLSQPGGSRLIRALRCAWRTRGARLGCALPKRTTERPRETKVLAPGACSMLRLAPRSLRSDSNNQVNGLGGRFHAVSRPRRPLGDHKGA